VPRFSVVVPTFQRSELVQECVRALDRQRFDGTWEILVVVDGSTDGTVEALRRLDVSIPLTIVEQPNRGVSAARNRGAAEARGELVLFLDDDMEADPAMLAEHDRSHRADADAVMGDMPLHPDSPPTLISEAVQQWADERIKRLSASDAPLPYPDLLGGQLSVRRDILESLAGFDPGLRLGQDLDFGYRLIKSGHRVVFNPAAVSMQKYVVTPASHLRQWRDAGRASVALVRKHPEARAELQEMLPAQSGWKRWAWRPLLATPVLGRALIGAARAAALMAVRDGARGGERAKRFFFAVRDAEHLRGTIEGGGVPTGPVVCVLAYHAVEDLRDDPVLAAYGVPPDLLGRQLDGVAAAGFRFVGLSEALDALRGGAEEHERLALVTFDDCYTSVLDAAAPVLRGRGVPAVAFAVSGHVGGTNAWDRETNAGELGLLDAEGLRALAEAGFEIGAHSRTHRPLPSLDAAGISDEIRGSIDDVEALGLPRPRAIAYPHGEEDERVRAAAAEAGLEAGFTTRLGLASPVHDPLALPRIEVTPREVGLRLRLKLAAARAPAPVSRRFAKWSLRSVR
jgi:glycosyltransferase involved in cell wall biosynthesis/peptidoglycan/xylan/chitin deacetylase (PgdA/CDA1 family)